MTDTCEYMRIHANTCEYMRILYIYMVFGYFHVFSCICMYSHVFACIRMYSHVFGICTCMYSHASIRMYSHEFACIRMYLHVFACIVMYRRPRCIEYVYRGARSIHVFGIGEIHEIHARYKGKQNGGGARHNTGQKEGNTRRYTHLGENRPHIWGKSAPHPLLTGERPVGAPRHDDKP